MEWQKQSQKHAKLKEKFNQLLGAVRTEKEARTVATAARADSTLESTTAKSSSTPAGQAAVVEHLQHHVRTITLCSISEPETKTRLANLCRFEGV